MNPTPHAITVYETRTANTFTYNELYTGHAMALIRMIEAGTGFLIADATDEIAPKIPMRIRTSWFTRNPPPETCPGYKITEPGKTLVCTRDKGHGGDLRARKCIARHPEYRTFTADNQGDVFPAPAY